MTLASASDSDPEHSVPDAIIALHARRCARPISDFAIAHPAVPRILVLTGTDLYRDIQTDSSAQRSLEVATRLVVLQDAGLQELTPALREKTTVIYQSAPTLQPIAKRSDARILNVIMIGHLREEKDPETFMQAAALVTSPTVRLTHVGNALEAGLGELAHATQRAAPRYRWIGNQTHAATRQRLKRSYLMVISSRMEGGANVIIEAVTSGVPVLASDISGNRGMLGDDYAGYFPLRDSRALACLIDRAVKDPAFYAHLQLQCAARSKIFSPERENAAVLQLVDNCLNNRY